MRCLGLLRISMLAALILAGPLFGRSATADDLVERARLDALARPLVDEGWVYGMTIGLIGENGTQIVGYGSVSEENSATPGADTLFEIGSISKVFTGLILAKMVEDGTVALEEPVQDLLGDSMTVPKGEREITLVDLSTHSSGLPRMPTNFNPKDPGNPYADYTVEQMAAFLGKHKLRRQPGEKFEYSNLAVGLLGHALARKSNMSYEALLAKTVCGPLGLSDTVITLDEAHQARLAKGHDFDGSPVPNWDIPTFAGAGAIRSTAADMLKFLAAQIGLDKTPLESAIRASHVVHFENGDGASDVALGWLVQKKEPKMIWHNGGTGGYHSFAGFSPQEKIGVVVLAGSATGHVDTLGTRLIELLTTGEAEPLKLPKTVPVTAEQLKPLVGNYKLSPLMTAEVTRDGDRLFVQLTGQPKIGLYPESKTHFFCRPVEASFDFETDDDGKIERMIIHQNGRDIPANRAE